MEAPDYFLGSYFCSENPQFTPEKSQIDPKSGDSFIVEDLIDFSKEGTIIGEGTFDTVSGNSIDSSTVTSFPGEPHFSSNFSCMNLTDQFSGDLYVPGSSSKSPSTREEQAVMARRF